MPDALIGYTGFVGSTLAKQMSFDHAYNSSTIPAMAWRKYGLVVCAGAPGRKWFANQNPSDDARSMERLWGVLKTVETERLVLISTVDVYGDPRGVDEASVCHPRDAYGRHRLALERAVRHAFGSRALIVRLPALFGDGLKKNALYDLMNGRGEAVPENASYQWYGLSWLAEELEYIAGFGHQLVNLVSVPITMGEVRDRFFPKAELAPPSANAASYDIRSLYCSRLSKETVLREMGEFIGAVPCRK